MREQENCWLKQEDLCDKSCCNKFCLQYVKLNTLYNNALVSIPNRKHLALRVDNDGSDDEAFSQLKSIENNIVDFIKDGQNLFIYSGTFGCGKTSWSFRMIQSYFNKIWYRADLTCKALFISVPRFLLAIKDNINSTNEYASYIQENVLKADLVVWDDIGTKVGTEFEISHLLSIIDARISAGKSNIYTTNLVDNELVKSLGDRLYSRIVNYSNYVIELKGKDKRGLNK